MSEKWNNRVIALAGTFQAATLVQQLASTGSINNQQLQTSVQSLFNQNPESVLDVYERIGNLETGLEKLHAILNRNNTQDSNNIVRYVMGILHLQKNIIQLLIVLLKLILIICVTFSRNIKICYHWK